MNIKHNKLLLNARRTGNSAIRPLVILSLVILALLISIQPVYAAPSIVPSSLPTGEVGTTYFTSLLAVGGTPPYTWSLVSGATPPGTALNADGTITGIPTAAGSFNFIVEVADDVPETAQQGFFIKINQQSLTISTSTFSAAKEGSSYTAVISVSGGTYPYTFNIVNGNLPDGLFLDPTNGYISGTPELGTYGSYSFTVEVTDNSSPQLTGQRSFSIYVEKGSFQPTITIGSGLEAGTTKVFVQGSQAATLAGGESLKLVLDLGASKIVSVEPVVPHPTEDGVRFAVETDEIAVNESQPNAVFNYYTEYKVNIETKPSHLVEPSGEGWYKEDSTFTASAQEIIEADTDTRYQFSHWLLPGNNRTESEDVSFVVEEPTTITVNYEIYYRLTVLSEYSETTGGGWYKAGSEVNWQVVNDKVNMPGLIGFFQGKYQAINPRGTVLMDTPRDITVSWEPNYLLPSILIPLVVILVLLAAFGIFFLLRRPGPQPRPIPFAPMPQPIAPKPIPQHHTTVVMIGDKEGGKKQLPQSTKEQLMEKFGELLERYEDEIRTTIETDQTPKISTVTEGKQLEEPKGIPPDVVDAEYVHDEHEEEEEEEEEEEGAAEKCEFSAKKLLRTVTTEWRQVDSRTVKLPPTKTGAQKSQTGMEIEWVRDIYHEWEIVKCSLPAGHTGKHKGSVNVVYSLLNTVNEKKTYGPRKKIAPPTPHFTDGMPEEEISDDQIVDAEELPSETLK
jgi:hypothetical protein